VRDSPGVPCAPPLTPRGRFLRLNDLTGGIPSCLGTLSDLVFMCVPAPHASGLKGGSPVAASDLRSNLLTGPIPVSLSNLTQLQYLCEHAVCVRPLSADGVCSRFLYDNQLTGIIPPSFGNLHLLQQLYDRVPVPAVHG
jgi:hypothetical protein